MYKVLWIDDEPKEGFINLAYENDIEIEIAKTHDEGMTKLLDPIKIWDAIILDANCKIHDVQETPNIISLNKSILEIHAFCKRRFIPWFVFTGGGYEGFESIKYLIGSEREWDDRNFYLKTTKDREALFVNLKKAADSTFLTRVKIKYSDIIEVCQDKYIGGTSTEDVISLLQSVERDEISNSSIANVARKVLEDFFMSCHRLKLLPADIETMNDQSKFLCRKEMTQIFPIYCQQILYPVVSVCQDGSHRLIIDNDVRSRKAPYLLRSTIFSICNLLIWLKNFIDQAPDNDLITECVSKAYESYKGQKYSGNILKGEINKKEFNKYAFLVPEDKLENIFITPDIVEKECLENGMIVSVMWDYDSKKGEKKRKVVKVIR